MFSSNLEKTLREAYNLACNNKHEFVTLEHLLIALLDDQDANEVLIACGVDIEELRAVLNDFIVNVLIAWSKASKNEKDYSFRFLKKIPKSYRHLTKIQNSLLQCYFDLPDARVGFEKLINDKEFTFSRHSNPSKLIVMLHGYGDNAENFINIANYIDKPEWNAQYIALNAPSHVPNYPTGYLWFDIYPNGKYISEASPKEILAIRQEVSVAIKKIEISINNNLKKFELNHNQCILLGFSQGGMMAFEFGNYFQNTLGGIAIFSGRIKNEKKI